MPVSLACFLLSLDMECVTDECGVVVVLIACRHRLIHKNYIEVSVKSRQQTADSFRKCLSLVSSSLGNPKSHLNENCAFHIPTAQLLLYINTKLTGDWMKFAVTHHTRIKFKRHAFDSSTCAPEIPYANSWSCCRRLLQRYNVCVCMECHDMCVNRIVV